MRLPFVAAPLWWVGARCRIERVPISTFYSREKTREARGVCRDCPVRYRCLTEHLDEQFGVWGGHSKDERSRIRLAVDGGATLEEASRAFDKRRRNG